MDHQIPVKRPDLEIINKKKNPTCHLLSENKESKKIEKYLDLARELKKL